MAALVDAFPSYTFVFPDAPYAGRLWIRDPPGGKGEPTTDPYWDSVSLRFIDDVVAQQGPFDAILGYSQGGAMVSAYLSHAPPSTFQQALIFCGYLPTTHEGIIGRIDQNSPFTTSSFHFMGQRDWIISNALSRAAARKYVSPTISVSSTAGHALPRPSDPSFAEATSFLAALAPPTCVDDDDWIDAVGDTVGYDEIKSCAQAARVGGCRYSEVVRKCSCSCPPPTCADDDDWVATNAPSAGFPLITTCATAATLGGCRLFASIAENCGCACQ